MSDQNEEKNKNCTFKSMFKKRRGGGGGMMARKRKESSSSSSGDDTTVVKTEKKTAMNRMIQKSSGAGGRKKRTKHNGSDSDNSDSDPGQGSSSKGSTGTGTSVAFASSGAEIQRTDQGATAIRQLDTDESMDARAIHERAAAVHQETKGKEDDKLYRGINNYSQYIEKRESLIGVRKSIKGPIRAPTNIRSTVRWDYEPMICKDYKETGYCGFGDSCKFMHDRSDYKFGWQLEREVEQGTYHESDDEKYVISSDDDDLPLKCPICRKVFTVPIVTKCKHYFCEKCAIENYKKSQRCHECGKQTHGMFNPAKDMIARLAKREASGKEVPDSSDDDETLPNHSRPPIPEDDPDYYSVVHEETADELNSY